MVISITLSLLLTGQIAPDQRAEMRRVFSSLVELSRPTNLAEIRATLAAPPEHLWAISPRSGFLDFGTGMAMVTYTNRGDFRGYSCMKVPTGARIRTNADFVDDAEHALEAIGFWGDRVEFEVTRGPLSIHVDARPLIHGVPCTHDAGFDFDPLSGRLTRAFAWDRLDYERFGSSPRVTRQQALLGALEAYGGFHPFSAARVGEVRPYIGIPASAEVRTPTYSEITAEEQLLFRNMTALPLYYVTFDDASNTAGQYGNRHIVVVNGLNGRPLVIYPVSERSNRSEPKSNAIKPPSGVVRVSEAISGFKGSASQVKSGSYTGKPVWLRWDAILFDARLDGSRVSIRDGDNLASYAVGGKLKSMLAKKSGKRRVFPRKPAK